jgi:hypothetical protein
MMLTVNVDRQFALMVTVNVDRQFASLLQQQ